MTFKYQEYLIKMKMVRQLWTQFKIKFLLNYNTELLCCEWDKNLGGGESTGINFFPGGEMNSPIFSE